MIVLFGRFNLDLSVCGENLFYDVMFFFCENVEKYDTKNPKCLKNETMKEATAQHRKDRSVVQSVIQSVVQSVVQSVIQSAIQSVVQEINVPEQCHNKILVRELI